MQFWLRELKGSVAEHGEGAVRERESEGPPTILSAYIGCYFTGALACVTQWD